MPTVSAKVNDKELEIIVEYANQCGETVSNLIKKVVIVDATFLDGGWSEEHPEYEHSMVMPKNTSDDEDVKITEANVNKIRKILGWKEIKL